MIGMLKRHEGLRLKPYQDTIGKLTIGYGRNLDDRGISKEEAEYLLKNDISRVMSEVRGSIDFFDNLNEARQNVLLDMCFNMGLAGLLGFQKMLKSLNEGNYAKAAEEMLNSKWASQVGNRAKELAKMVKSED